MIKFIINKSSHKKQENFLLQFLHYVHVVHLNGTQLVPHIHILITQGLETYLEIPFWKIKKIQKNDFVHGSQKDTDSRSSS